MKYRDILHIDAETFYDREYSLSKMPTILYVRDPRFKLLGVAVAMNDEPSRYMAPDEFEQYLSTIDWATTAVQAFNAAFDALILTERYKIQPCYYLCSLSAARALMPLDKMHLKNVAPALGLGEKGNALVEGASESSQALADYACNDNELARGIYKTLYPLLPRSEQDLINWTIRSAVEPIIELDAGCLEQVIHDVTTNRDAAIALSGYSKDELSSNQKFAGIIKELGLQPPVKISNTTGEETTAFSKNDNEWVEFKLAYPEYQNLWDARQAAKSTIEITRAQRLLDIANSSQNTLGVPLKYHGASTARWSASDRLNLQNLPSKHKSKLRYALRAPSGKKMVIADASQIELRVNAWFSGQQSVLDILTSGGDVYVAEAARQFNINGSDVTKVQRQFGKIVTLGLGYSLGSVKFRKMCAAGPLGGDPIYLSSEEAYNTVTKYRDAHPSICATWRLMDHYLLIMASPGARAEYKGLVFTHEAVTFPSGRVMQYPALQQTEDGGYIYGIGEKPSYLYGAKLAQNIVQSLARDILASHLLIIDEKYRVVHSVHDELVAIVDNGSAADALKFMLQTMSTTPSWTPGLPLAAEGLISDTYSK